MDSLRFGEVWGFGAQGLGPMATMASRTLGPGLGLQVITVRVTVTDSYDTSSKPSISKSCEGLPVKPIHRQPQSLHQAGVCCKHITVAVSEQLQDALAGEAVGRGKLVDAVGACREIEELLQVGVSQGRWPGSTGSFATCSPAPTSQVWAHLCS